MIRVTIELLRYGREDDKEVLGQLHIGNDASGDQQIGNYDVKIFSWGQRPRIWKRGRVEGFPRINLGPWDLLYRALRATVGDRNP